MDKVKVETLASRRLEPYRSMAQLFARRPILRTSLDSGVRGGRERPSLSLVSRCDSLRGALPRFFTHRTLAGREKEVRLDTVLLRVQFVVAALGGVERPVSPALDDPPRFDHQNLIGAADGREAVRDHEGRAAPHQVGESLLNQRFGLGIEA